MEFYFFRHGQTDWNAAGKIQGHSDIPLNEVGKSEAELLRQRIADLKLEIVYSSDLLRARETAQIATTGLNLEIIHREELREGNFGEVEGKNFEEVFKQSGEEFWSMDKKNWDLRVPGGESKNEVIVRVNSVLEEIVSKDSHRVIGISTHGGLIRNMVHSIKDLEERTPIPNCCIYRFKILNNQWSVEGPL